MLRFFSLLLLAALLCGLALATPTENQRMFVLPAPGKVVIDGKFADWDLSGGMFACANCEASRDLGYVWYHAMYDAENFYLMARIKDPHPMQLNDRLEARMTTDQFNHMSFALDFYTKEKVINIKYGPHPDYTGELPNAMKNGAQMAFQVDADGKGYVQEIALPWKIIGKEGRAYGAGDTLRLWLGTKLDRSWAINDLFAPNPDRVFVWRSTGSWGYLDLVGKNNVEPRPVRLEDNRLFNVKMTNGLPQVDWTGLIEPDELPGHLPITFSLKKDTLVTIAIDDANGQRVRNLVSNRFFTAGTHTVNWDGLRDGAENKPGVPAEPGQYTWKGITHDPLHLEYKGIFHNAGQLPWTNGMPTTDWGGDFGPPISAVADGDRVYLGWGSGEASTQLIAVDFTGKKIWGARKGWSSTVLLCKDGDNIYCGPNGKDIYLVNATNGQFKGFPSTGLSDMRIPPVVGEEITVPTAMAARDGKLYMTFEKLNLIGRLDVQTGKFDATYPVNAPGRITVAGSGLLLISGGKVVRMDPASGGFSDVITSKLEEPKSLAVDGQGNIYVADWGKSQQVKVFTADGKFIRAIGKKGGRRTRGAWQREGLYKPLGLTVDVKGQVWIGDHDDSPKRWTIWTSKGKLVKELFGPSHYGSDGGALHPDDPYLGVGVNCEWRVNPKTGRETCLGTIIRDDMCNVPFPLDAHASRFVRIGKDWYLFQGLHRYYSMLKIFKREGTANYRLVAVLGNAYEFDGKKQQPLPYAAHPFFAGHKDDFFAWADRNGDGQVQQEEIAFRKAPIYNKTPMRISGSWQHLGVNADGTAFFPMSDRSIWRFAVGGMTKAGAPIFDLAQAAPIPDATYGGGYSSVMASVDGDMVVSHSNPLKGIDVQSGKTLWTYPNDWNGVHGSHRAPAPKVGLLRGTFAVVGSAKLKSGEELFMINANVGEWHAFTKDGLYVSNLFNFDPVKVKWPTEAKPGVLLDTVPPGLGAEDFGGFFTGTKDGRAFIQAGKTGFWIIELTGVDSLARLSGGSVALTEDDLVKSKDYYSIFLQKSAGPRITEVTRATPVIDGTLDEWAPTMLTGFRFDRTGAALMSAGLSYDDKNLYLAYKIEDRAGTWMNAATDFREIYARGDTVDLQLSTNPQTDMKRQGAQPGDLRLSIGNVLGKNVAVIYREKGPAMGGKPAQFGSGVVHSFTVDSVRQVEEATIAVTKTNTEYIVEAAIPLSALGLTAQAGLELRGDFGVTVSNKEGADVAQRVYWSNQNTGLVSDEVYELKIEPRNWGVLKFK